jgi:hypothetical protein
MTLIPEAIHHRIYVKLIPANSDLTFLHEKMGNRIFRAS